MRAPGHRFAIAATMLVGILLPVPTRATRLGGSISLSPVTLGYDPYDHNLSAWAAAIGTSPALALPNNGIYSDTLAGDYAVTLNLPPLDQPEFWHVTYLITINGKGVFGNSYYTDHAISINDGWNYFLKVVPAPGLVKILFHTLLTKNELNTGGLIDYVYNFDPSNKLDGTFAVGSTKDWATLIGLPSGEFPPGKSALTLSVSAFAVPEPSTVLMCGAALLGLAWVRRRAGQPPKG